MPLEEDLLREIEEGVAALDLPPATAEEALLADFAKPLLVSLLTVDPVTNLPHEVDYPGYQRQHVQLASADAFIVLKNKQYITFPQSRGSSPVVTHVGLHSEDGELLGWAPIATSHPASLIASADTVVQLPPGGITIKLS